MNRRINKILNELIWNDDMNLNTFIEKYSVQERSIRLDMKSLNEEMKEFGLPKILESADGNIKIENKAKASIQDFEKFISSFDFYTYTMTRKERTTILALIILNGKETITVDKLKNEIGVSRNTILNDLQELKNWFEDRGMTMEAKTHQGYVVDASELKIRDSLLKLLEVNGDDYSKSGYMLDVFWNLLLQQVDDLQCFSRIKMIILEEEEKEKITLEDYSFSEAVMELTIVANRIFHGKQLGDDAVSNQEELKKSSKYQFAEQILNRIGAEFELEISEKEVLEFTSRIRSKRYLKGEERGTNALDVRVMIAEAIHQICNQLSIDLYLDFGLYDLMLAHMKSAVYRLKNNETIVNPFKDKIREDYSDILEVVQSNITNIEDYIGKKFSEDDVFFLVLYFASVIEKEKVENRKKIKIPVALVCATGRGTVQFMLAKLKVLEDIIDIVSISSHHNMKEIEQSGALMIISTIPLPDVELANVVIESPMINENDLLRIQQKVFEIKGATNEALIQEKKDTQSESSKTNIQGAFYDLLSEDRICLDYEAKNWEEAIRCAGNLLYETDKVEMQYVEAMVNNVKKHGPYIVVCKGMALPHADVSQGVKEEAVSFVRLKTPIEFGSVYNDPVQYVIGMSIKSAESINQAIYDLMMIFGNEENMRRFDQLPTTAAVLEQVKALQGK